MTLLLNTAHRAAARAVIVNCTTDEAADRIIDQILEAAVPAPVARPTLSLVPGGAA